MVRLHALDDMGQGIQEHARVHWDPQMQPGQPAAGLGGQAVVVGSAVEVSMDVVDSNGNSVSLPADDSRSSARVDVELPAMQAADPSCVFAWVSEVEDQGQTIGYFRGEATFDPSTNSLHQTSTVDALEQGVTYVPILFKPFAVENFDPSTHIYSGPTSDAVDFGVAGPQWTRFEVIGPQVGSRLYVVNTETGDYGWIEAGGVGPVE